MTNFELVFFFLNKNFELVVAVRNLWMHCYYW